MRFEELSPAMQAAYNALPTPEEKKAFLEEISMTRKNMMRGAVSAVIARNQSHGLGEEIREVVKEKDPEK